MGASFNNGKNNATKCTGPLCELPGKTRGLCNSHYKQTLKGNELKPLKMRKYFPQEYSSWSAMRARCLKVNGKDYPNYGGRGIKICPRWESFEYFLLDMGPRPFFGATIERLDNDKDYSPENCFWLSGDKQSKNRRCNKIDEKSAEKIKKLLKKFPIKEVSKIYNCSYCTIWRISKGIAWAE